MRYWGDPQVGLVRQVRYWGRLSSTSTSGEILGDPSRTSTSGEILGETLK